MPIMIRPKKNLGRKIAYNILGTPTNIKQDKPAFGQKVADKIFLQQTHNVR